MELGANFLIPGHVSLPQLLKCRHAMQLAPSFMDAPGASNVWLPGKPELLTLEKPNVIIAFASTVGLKVRHTM